MAEYTFDQDIVERFQADLLEWAAENHREFPWRDPDADLYEVFMSEMFLRRTRPDVVESFIPRFFEEYPDLDYLREAEQDEVASVIRPMGLQNKRAKGLIELAQAIDGDEIPTSLDELLNLPQVGPYVANATLCFGLGEQRPIVDRNVDRIYRRIFGDDWTALSDSEQWEIADEMVPEGQARLYNLGLIDFASIVCTAPEPICEDCFATDYCQYYQEPV